MKSRIKLVLPCHSTANLSVYIHLFAVLWYPTDLVITFSTPSFRDVFIGTGPSFSLRNRFLSYTLIMTIQKSMKICNKYYQKTLLIHLDKAIDCRNIYISSSKNEPAIICKLLLFLEERIFCTSALGWIESERKRSFIWVSSPFISCFVPFLPDSLSTLVLVSYIHRGITVLRFPPSIVPTDFFQGRFASVFSPLAGPIFDTGSRWRWYFYLLLRVKLVYY